MSTSPTSSAGSTNTSPGSTSPAATIAGGATGLSAPEAVAVAPPMGIANGSLPAAGLRRHYSTRLAAVLGSPPLRWHITRGHLSPGLSLSPSGHISGVARTLGRFAFTVKVTGSSTKVPAASRVARDLRQAGTVGAHDHPGTALPRAVARKSRSAAPVSRPRRAPRSSISAGLRRPGSAAARIPSARPTPRRTRAAPSTSP